MPSVLLTAASGSPFPIVSGNLWSGQGAQIPRTGVYVYLSPEASGFAYVSLSGGSTVNSGGFFLSGVNTSDGVLLAPGKDRFYPRSLFAPSGTLNLFATCVATASGQARLYWEAW